MPDRRVSARVRRTSPRQGPRAPLHLVERMQVAAIGMVNAYIDRLMRALTPLLEERFGKREDSALQDAASVRPGSGGLAEVFEGVPEGELTHGFLERMFRLVDRQAADDLQRVVPVPLRDVLPNAAELEAQWIDRNTSLIRLEERARKEVAGILDGPLREGVRVEEIRERIQERLGVVRSRAELIARDQTLKLYGQVQQERQTAVGIAEYTWSGSLDERERPDHLALEGTTQRWDAPPVVDKKTGRREHPGGDFQCRCGAIPILPDELTGTEEPANDNPTNDPANDVPPRRPEPRPLQPEEQELAQPLPEPPPERQPEPIEQERQRLAEERAAREAERARRAAEEARSEAERAELARQERQQRSTAARETLQRFAERVQLDASVPVEIREAAARAVEHVGLGNLGVLKLAPETGVKGAEGLYFPRTRDLNLKTQRLTASGRALPMVPGPGKLFSMGTQPATQEEAARNTLYHELGHHAHMHANPNFSLGTPSSSPAQRAAAKKIEAIVEERWRAADREYLTDYAQDPRTLPIHRSTEYFAEAFAAYHAEPAWLRRVAPKAHQMVADVLRLRKERP